MIFSFYLHYVPGALIQEIQENECVKCPLSYTDENNKKKDRFGEQLWLLLQVDRICTGINTTS
jgi:hypothetical protein